MSIGTVQRRLNHQAIPSQESVSWAPVKNAGNSVCTAYPIIRQFLTMPPRPATGDSGYLKPPTDGAFNKRGRSPTEPQYLAN